MGVTYVYPSFDHEAIARDLIHRLKFAHTKGAALEMARITAKAIQPTESTIVPIPTASSRVRQRGYDQTKLYARALARNYNLPYRDCLRRSGQAHQVGSSRDTRLRQLKDAYYASGMVPWHILLVDDVMTTGATISAAARVLKAAGAKRIDVLTFAHA